ncbi:LysM peptidoglycan-binding domain-containing protein [Streptomyces sp. NPDC096153]|uniref:LysM peptidoglycan-binding domain-containing protein n=1 Tax=Streptomyces sp. NPDC096153 TaxID=3155548 RepID=UPI003319BBF1
MAHRNPDPLRVASALLRALAGLAALVALVAGAPYLLLRLGHQPTDLTGGFGLLLQQDDGTLFLTVLTCIGWAGWSAFAVSVAMELFAVVRRRSAPRIKGLGGIQSLAGVLIGSILLLAPTAAAAATPAPAIAATAPQSTDDGGDKQRPAAGHAAVADAPTEAGVRLPHTVVSAAEVPWDIAERYLGDGTRWRDIAALNPDVPQLAAGDQVLPKGAVIALPPDARPAAPATSPGDAADAAAGDDTNAPEVHSTRTQAVDGAAPSSGPASGPERHAVREGDSLWSIADTYGDPSDWRDIYQANKGERQPGGRVFDNPHLIYPGQVLDLPPGHAAGPAPAETGPEGESTAPQSPEQESGGSAAPPPTSPPPQPDATAPPDAAQPPAESTPTPGAVPPVAPAPSASPTAATPPVSPSAPSTSALPTGDATAAGDHAPNTHQMVALVAGIGALLAASLAGALGVKRVLQQRRRRAGETIAIDADPTGLEQVINAGGEPAGIELLDTALRTLGHHAATTGRELPDVRGALVSDRTVRLIPDDPRSEPPIPFTADDTGLWTLDADADLLDQDTAGEVAAPYPALVTLGATDDGDLLLANLLHLRTLLLNGDADDVLAVARAMALEAGTSSWCDRCEVVTVGLGTRLAALLPKGRIRAMPQLPAVAADLGALLVEVHQNTTGPDTKGGDAAPPLPWILICATEVDAEHAWQLADAVAAARGLPVSVVLPAGEATRQAFPDAKEITATDGAHAEMSPLGRPVRLQRLSDGQYRQYVHALDVTEQNATPATGAWQLAEDHDVAAASPHPNPQPVPLQTDIDTSRSRESSHAGTPFPALLASATPSRIRLVAPSPATCDAAPPRKGKERADEPDPARPAPQDETGIDEDQDGSHAPRISVLGPLQVDGITHTGHGPKLAALAALIHLRPHRSADALCTAMDPLSPWSKRTLQSRLSELRSRLGHTANGQPYLPRPGKSGYAFHPAVQSDWTRFQQYAARGLAAGPGAGLPDLENALGLVRGRPFASQDYPWADSVEQEMLARITDIAHTLATWHAESDTPDLDAARHAALRGLDINETAEVLHRDMMLIERAAGNTAAVRKAVSRVQQICRHYDISPEPLTEQTIQHVLSNRPAHAYAAGRPSL